MKAFIIAVAVVAGMLVGVPQAHADYYNYPCNYPFVGTSADVDVIAHGGGQYCDGPMEVNGSHYHCESGGGGIGGGAIGLAPIGGLNLGGFGGSGIGMALGRCEWRCPDNTHALPPNPPAAWIQHLTVNDKYNDCRDHMAPAGMDSAPQEPNSGPPAPGKPDAPPPPPPADAPPPDAPPSPLSPGSPMQLP